MGYSCTGSVLASFEIPIILFWLILASILPDYLPPVPCFIISLSGLLLSLTIFHWWYWDDWPSIFRKFGDAKDDA